MKYLNVDTREFTDSLKELYEQLGPAAIFRATNLSFHGKLLIAGSIRYFETAKAVVISQQIAESEQYTYMYTFFSFQSTYMYTIHSFQSTYLLTFLFLSSNKLKKLLDFCIENLYNIFIELRQKEKIFKYYHLVLDRVPNSMYNMF